MKPLSKKQTKQIQIFKTQLLKTNQNINLFSRKNPENILEFLLNQSLLAGKSLQLRQDQSPVLDIGSGAGFPGIVFAVLFPKLCFVLCERQLKKAEFLKYILNQMEITNTKVFFGSVEDIGKSFPCVLSQAAMPLEKMLKILEKALSPKGQAFLWHSRAWKKAWPKTKKFKVQELTSYKIQNLEKVLLKIQKVKPNLIESSF